MNAENSIIFQEPPPCRRYTLSEINSLNPSGCTWIFPKKTPKPEALKCFSEAVVMYLGKVVERGPVERLDSIRGMV